jgi:hypothetical protein
MTLPAFVGASRTSAASHTTCAVPSAASTAERATAEGPATGMWPFARAVPPPGAAAALSPGGCDGARGPRTPAELPTDSTEAADGAAAAETAAGVDCTAGAEAAADGTSGRLGPNRTPARRGHAIPTTKPAAAMTATLLHDGRSCAGPGTCTTTGPAALRESIRSQSLACPAVTGRERGDHSRADTARPRLESGRHAGVNRERRAL